MTVPALPAGSLEEKVKARIQASMADLIDDEVLAAYVEKATRDYLYGAAGITDRTWSGYETVRAPEVASGLLTKARSLVQDTVNEAIAGKLRELIDLHMAQPEISVAIHNSALGIVSGLTPAFIQGLVQGLVQPLIGQIGPMVVSSVQSAIWSGQLQLPNR